MASPSLTDRIWRVRSWLAPHIRDIPGSSSYIMELDQIAHEVSLIEKCPHGWLKENCRDCINAERRLEKK